jgi:hypothetical protein
MKIILTIRFSAAFSLMVLATQLAAAVQLEICTNAEPQSIFSGEAKSVSVAFYNPGEKNMENAIRTRIIQTTSATAVLISDNPWKRLQVPAGETVLASAALNFPAVKAETKFLVQWLEDTNRIIGQTEVLVYPTNLLAELKPLAGGEALGIFDPQNQLKPLLKNLKLDFTDLEYSGLEYFSGRLAIIGPFQSQAKMRAGLAGQIRTLAKKGVAIVWIQPPPEKRDKLAPSFYSVPENTNAVVVVHPELLANLPDNPQAQLSLIYFCKLALQPKPLQLPKSTFRP